MQLLGVQGRVSPVKFGVTFPQTEIGTDSSVIRNFAQATEGAGFDYLVTYDHILGAHSDRFAGKGVSFPRRRLPFAISSTSHSPSPCGTVRWHGKDREEVYRRSIEFRPKRFAIVYTGKMPEATAMVL